MNLDRTGLDEAITEVRNELAALHAALGAIEEARGETRRRATAFEADIIARLDEMDLRVDQRISEHLDVQALVVQLREEVLARLETVEGTVSRLDAETAEARQFVRSVRSLRVLRARRTLLQRLHD